MTGQLLVRVNEELVLDAGTCRGVAGPAGPELLIRPPETTLFHQVLGYLQAKPDPPGRLSGSMVGREGVAAAALVLRWGSYLAVLLDRDRPLWSAVRSPRISRISDEEMARINIEASAALAQWIELYRLDPSGSLYTKLVNRAVSYLPMPQKRSKLLLTEFAAYADRVVAARLLQAVDVARLERVRADADCFPSRILANAVVNMAWRNGPVEDIHAGHFHGYPLGRRRMRPGEERTLMRYTSCRMALGMSVCQLLATERPQRPWAEQVLPYGLAVLLAPSGWTLAEASRAVRLAQTSRRRNRSHPEAWPPELS